jgi:hypothetical protein
VRRIKAFRIKKLFSVLSVTGGYCELGCSHCGGKYIRSMLPVSQKALPRLVVRLFQRGVRGFLLSGGWTREGYLPLSVDVMEELAKLRKRYGIVFNVHLGLETRRDVLYVAREAFDIIDFEFTLNKWLVSTVRGLSYGPKRYVEALDAMLDAGLRVVPHVFLWLPKRDIGELRSELSALSDRGLDVVNLLVYIPPQGDIDSSTAKTLPQILRHVRSIWDGNIYIGCMRPRTAKKFLDKTAVEEGLVDRIANPSLAVVREYHELLEFYDACCSVPEDKLSIFGPENIGI